MTQEIDKTALRNKVAKWLGFTLETRDCVGLIYYEEPQRVWYYKGHEYGWNPPNFPEDETACFKLPVPKLLNLFYHVSLHIDTQTNALSNALNPLEDIYHVKIKHLRSASKDWDKGEYEADDTSLATALCLAIEKLIDEEVKK